MSLVNPSGTVMKKAAAWELITASIILFFMIMYKSVQMYFKSQPGSGILPYSVNKFISKLMGENEYMHLGVYLVIFILVFSSAIMGFFYNEDK